MSTNEPRQTKADRRDAARAEALALREAQAKRDKRNRAITIGALVGGLAVLIGAFLWVFIPAMQQKEARTTEPLTGVTAPATANDTGGIPVGADGVAGTTNEDAVEVGVYFDYLCPVCGQFEDVNAASIDEMREAGDITLVQHPVSILDRLASGSQFSTRSAATAAYVAEHAPEQFNAFNEAMFANQPEENTAGLTDAQLAEIARTAGVPADVAEAIAAGTPVKEFGDWVEGATNLATQNPDLQGTRGFGTPTITIDGERWEGNWADPAELKKAVEEAKA
ncbi:thioredoxin domain-containing protein [Oerskovia sp. Sa1BUA8]|uniref:Thioredoxin domain-containing protein n=1 Tax=Oerskovia douganii TaxID=2762210 RepID=A0A9D5YXU0_9CELL|nr:thioredoxin domain-containing protein [Oerskovia douganii]MBE7699232.1 thioredoxin domain-containing protein [Oerskovia douganii]